MTPTIRAPLPHLRTLEHVRAVVGGGVRDINWEILIQWPLHCMLEHREICRSTQQQIKSVENGHLLVSYVSVYPAFRPNPVV